MEKRIFKASLGWQGQGEQGKENFETCFDSVLFSTGKLSLIWYILGGSMYYSSSPLRHFRLFGTCRDAEEVCEEMLYLE